MTDMMFWLLVAYISFALAIILSVVTLGVARRLRSDEWRACVATALHEVATASADIHCRECGAAAHIDTESCQECGSTFFSVDQADPDEEEEDDLFTPEQELALKALYQSGAAHVRRRMERVIQEAR